MTYSPPSTDGANATRIQIIGPTGSTSWKFTLSLNGGPSNGGSSQTFSGKATLAHPQQVLADLALANGAPITKVELTVDTDTGYSDPGPVVIDALRIEYTRDSGAPNASTEESPQRVTATPENASILLSWDKAVGHGASVNDAWYNVYSSPSDSFSSATLLTSTPISPATTDANLRMSYLDTAPTPGQVNFYWVTATSYSTGATSSPPSTSMTSGAANTDLALNQSGTDPPDASTNNPSPPSPSSAANAFDGNNSTSWTPATGGSGEWVEVNFNAPTTFNQAKIVELGHHMSDFKIQYCSGTDSRTGPGRPPILAQEWASTTRWVTSVLEASRSGPSPVPR